MLELYDIIVNITVKSNCFIAILNSIANAIYLYKERVDLKWVKLRNG